MVFLIITFKIACIAYKTISTNQPAYLHSPTKHYVYLVSCMIQRPHIFRLSLVAARYATCSSAWAALTIWNTFLWTCTCVYSYAVFVRNWKLSITKLLGHLSGPPLPLCLRFSEPLADICALYKFTSLLIIAKRLFTDWMLFLSPSQQCTEGMYFVLVIYSLSCKDDNIISSKWKPHKWAAH